MDSLNNQIEDYNTPSIYQLQHYFFYFYNCLEIQFLILFHLYVSLPEYQSKHQKQYHLLYNLKHIVRYPKNPNTDLTPEQAQKTHFPTTYGVLITQK